MKITEFETWCVSRDKCLFDAKRQGGAAMNWDVIAIRIGTDAGIDGIATCLAARSGGVSAPHNGQYTPPRRKSKDFQPLCAVFRRRIVAINKGGGGTSPSFMTFLTLCCPWRWSWDSWRDR